MILVSTLLGSTVRASEVDSVHFHVEFTDAAKDDAKIEELASQIVAKLREHVDQTTEPSTGVDNRLIVVVSDKPDAQGDYLVRLVAIANSNIVGSTDPLACVACGADELAAMAIDMLPPMLEVIAAAELPPTTEPPPEPAQTELEHVPEPVLPSNRKQRTLQIAGTTTAVTGALMLGAGGALLAVGKVFPRDTNGLVIDQIDYRPTGAILIGAGAALVVTGLVCFGLGSRKRSGVVSVAPVMNHEVTGGMVMWAF